MSRNHDTASAALRPKADGSALHYIERMEQGVIGCPCSPMDTRRQPTQA